MSTTSPQTTISLHHWRFLSFLGAQFLGAFNDNAFKLVLSMAALSLFPDPKTQAGYVALISSLAILPFLCFSGYAGYFADKYAKSTVLRITNTESKQVTHQGQKSPENSQNNDPKNALNEIEISNRGAL
jgi:MFS family permease